jgi:hypothetical protein
MCTKSKLFLAYVYGRLRVVKLEPEVWQDEGGLDGGEIGVNDCGGGVSVRKVAMSSKV